MVYTGRFVVFRPLFDWAEGKPSGLNHKYDRHFRFITNLVGVPFYKFIRPILNVSTAFTVFIFAYSNYTKCQAKFNILFYILFALYYYYVLHVLISSILIVATVIDGHSFYLRFRFRQVSELFRSNKLNDIIRAIVEHNQLCYKVDEFNKIVSKPIVVFYIVATFSIGLFLYLTLYGQNTKFRILTGFCSLLLLIAAFYTYCAGALFSSEAHSPYANVNSFIVKKNSLSFKSKWKVR